LVDDQDGPLTDEQLTWLDRVQPGIAADARAIVPPTDGMPIWVTVDVERWFGALTALSADILTWALAATLTPARRKRAAWLAKGAAIAAVRPDGVLQERALEHFREEFETLKGEQE
jgi:hypothetical protein